MRGYKISEVIKSLEELKEDYGDVRVITKSFRGEESFVDYVEISENNHEIVAEIHSWM